MIKGEKKCTVFSALKWAEGYLKGFNIPAPTAEAEYLLAHILRWKRAELFINRGRQLTEEDLRCFEEFIFRRAKREPSQYITGEVEFRGLSFKVASAVLIPRPETELLVEEAVKIMERQRAKGKGQKAIIIDLCTGSGCIAVSIAKEINECRIYAIDISNDALKVARENAEQHGVEQKITFLHGSFLESLKDMGLEGGVDLMLSNPPYVSKKETEELQPEIKDYEPFFALYGGEDGIDSYRRIIPEAKIYLKQGGYLILEIGHGQAAAIKELFGKESMYSEIELIKDLAGIERIVKAIRI